MNEKQARRRIRKLTEALSFYASEPNWTKVEKTKYPDFGAMWAHGPPTLAEDDRGAVARSALEELAKRADSDESSDAIATRIADAMVELAAARQDLRASGYGAANYDGNKHASAHQRVLRAQADVEKAADELFSAER